MMGGSAFARCQNGPQIISIKAVMYDVIIDGGQCDTNECCICYGPYFYNMRTNEEVEIFRNDLFELWGEYDFCRKMI